MKIKPEHYDVLKEAIAKIDRADIERHREYIKQEGRSKDREKRLRWDCFYASGTLQWACKTLDYMHDTHMDTALRRIMRELELLPDTTTNLRGNTI